MRPDNASNWVSTPIAGRLGRKNCRFVRRACGSTYLPRVLESFGREVAISYMCSVQITRNPELEDDQVTYGAPKADPGAQMPFSRQEEADVPSTYPAYGSREWRPCTHQACPTDLLVKFRGGRQCYNDSPLIIPLPPPRATHIGTPLSRVLSRGQ